MPKTREHDETDDAEVQRPLVKRTRRLSTGQEHQQHTTSAPPCHSPHTSDKTSLRVSNNHLPSPESHPHSGIEGVNFPDSYELPPSPVHIPSGIEGVNFPDSYELPPSPVRIPSGIEGVYFPDSYELPPSPVHIPSGIEGVYFPDSYHLPSSPHSSDSSSTPTVMSSPMVAQQGFEQQYHFYNEPTARERGTAILDSAREVLNRLRGSPTAKEKVSELQEAARKTPILGETDFRDSLASILLNPARMVPKAGITPGKATGDDFNPIPKAWVDDFLGHRRDATFRSDSIPQAVAAKDSFEEAFGGLPKMQFPVPDIVYGLSAELLPQSFYKIFNGAQTKVLTKQIHHCFLAGDFKTLDRPFIEAVTQCQRSGSAMVFYSANWNDEANGKIPLGTITALPKVDVNKDKSTPDHASVCYTVAISTNIAYTFINWREVWSNGAIYWHTSVLDQYSFEYGMHEATEKFQKHMSNIVDWGIGERADEIYKQAEMMAKRKMVSASDFQLPNPKRQRTGAPDDSD